MAKKANKEQNFGEKTWSSIKNNWKPIVWVLAPILIIVIIFALPIKTATIQETEQYWDTEMKSEPYTASESYTTTEPYTETEMRSETIYDSYVSTSWSQTFKVSKDSTVTVNYYGAPYYYQPSSIYCSTDNASSCRIWSPSFPHFYGTGRATIKVSYPEPVTKYRTVTKYRDVTKYREVPTQVLKERTVDRQVRMSIWVYLFR